MKKSKFEKLTSESLLVKKSNYKKGFVALGIITMIISVLWNIPNILGGFYPSPNVFTIIFVVCFVWAIMVFRDWNAVKKELNKRDSNQL